MLHEHGAGPDDHTHGGRAHELHAGHVHHDSAVALDHRPGEQFRNAGHRRDVVLAAEPHDAAIFVETGRRTSHQLGDSHGTSPAIDAATERRVARGRSLSSLMTVHPRV